MDVALTIIALLVGALICFTAALVWFVRDNHKRVTGLTERDEALLKQMRDHDQKMYALNVDVDALATRQGITRYGRDKK